MPFEDPPVEQEIALYYKGIKSATLSVGASDTQDTSGCDYVCDGTCDEVEINQAIAALPATGGLIHLLEGTYNVCGPIVIDKDNVAILGTGANTVIRVRNGHDVNINVIEVFNHTDLLIKDLRIDGNRANQTAGVMYGIYFNLVTRSKVSHCWVENMYGGHGVYLENTSLHNTITGNTCEDNDNHGIYLTGVLGANNYNTIAGNICQGNTGHGIYLFTSCYNNTITGNTCQGNTGDGIFLSDACPNNTITGNTCQGNTGQGIHILRSCYNNTVASNACQDNDSGIYLSDLVNDNTVTGNTCQGSNWYGIYVDHSHHSTITGNTVSGNNYSIHIADSTYNTVTGNTCQGNDHYGIALASSEHNTITGNTCEDNDWHGIRLTTSNDNTIVGNEIVNNGLAADITYDGINVDTDSNYNNVQGNTIRTTVAAPPPNRQRYGINIANVNCDGNLVANNDLYQSGQTAPFNDAGTGTRGITEAATLVVAASNSLDIQGVNYHCDGTSDETEINAAITALGATGGTVKLLEGTFTVDGDIVLASNVALVGQGAGTVITIPDGHDVGIHIIQATNHDNLLIKDLRIDGNKANQTAGTMHGIYFDTTTHSKVVNCWVEDMYGGDGIYMAGASEYNIVTGNTFRGNGSDGVYIVGCGHNEVHGNTVTRNDEHGIWLVNSWNNIVADNEVIENSLGTDNTYDGISVSGTSNRNNIHGNTVRTTTAAPLPNRQRYGINIAAGTENLVKDNDPFQSGQTALFNDAGTDTKLPELWVNSIFDDSDANATLSNIGDHVSIEMADDLDTFVRFNFRVPSDFHELVRACVVVVSAGTGDLAWIANTDWGGCNELHNVGSDTTGPMVTGVTLNQIACLRIDAPGAAGALDGITAGDHVGVQFLRNASIPDDTIDGAVHLLQFWMQYV